MAAYQIDCVIKDDGTDDDMRIRYIGGFDRNGNRWRLSVDEAIARLKNPTLDLQFYVVWDHAKVRVDYYPKHPRPNERQYLRTDPDETEFNNLLYLRDCGYAEL